MNRFNQLKELVDALEGDFEKFYEKGYSGIDLIEYISETWDDTNSEKHKP